MNLLLLIGVYFFALSAWANNSCDPFFQSPQLERAVSEYQTVLQVGPIWNDYNPSLHPITIVQPEIYKQCAVLIQGQRVQKIQLDESFGSIPRYKAFRDQASAKEIPQSYKTILNNLDIHFNLLVNLNHFINIENKHANGQWLDRSDTQSNWISLIIHEGFHLFAGGPHNTTTQPWPIWDQQPHRDFVDTICYFDREIQTEFKRELTFLQQAVHALLVDHDKAVALKHSKAYIDALHVRRNLQKDARVPISYDEQETRFMSCAQAEAIMEIEEGVADFVGMYTAISAKTATFEKASAWMEAWEVSDGELYYITGEAKLFLIAVMNPQALAASVTRILYSPSWDKGIQFEFESFIAEESKKYM